MKNINLIVGVVVSGVVCGGIGFWGGSQYNSNKLDQGIYGRRMYDQNGTGMMNNRNKMDRDDKNGAWMGNGMNRGGGMVVGEISSIDGDKITVKLADGSSKLVVLANSTTYTISSDVSKDKLSVGAKVAVMGSDSNDGTTSATSIELNPALRGQAINNK